MNIIETPVEVGQFGSVYGVRGWLRIHSYTEIPESIFEYKPWFIKNKSEGWREIQLVEWKRHAGGYICKLEGFDQREDAQFLTNFSVFIDESVLPELPEGEFYINSLIGMKVINQEGYDLGEIVDLMETGANDVLVIKANENDEYGKKERLLPLVFDTTILNVDKDTNIVNVIWDPDF